MTDEDSRRYVIDPRIYRKYYFYIGVLLAFWLIWTPVTAVITLLAIFKPHPFFFIWLTFGYLGTILIPFVLLRMNKRQLLEVTEDSLLIYGTGFRPSSHVSILKQNLAALTLEHHCERRGGRKHGEGVYTLNLFQKRGVRSRRIMLASFVHPKDKAILLGEIEVFLFSHGFELEVKNEVAAKKDAE
jgi:hypothetical protein